MKRFLLLALVSLVSMGQTASSTRSESADAELYVVNPPAFREDTHHEVRLTGGFDFSNPYVQSISGGLGVYQLLSPSMAVGLEGAVYHAAKRETTKEMERKMKEYGYKVYFHAPEWSTNVAVRMNPFTGILNLQNSNYTMTELALLFRAGVLEYSDLGLSPLLGTGLELNLGLNANVGLNLAVTWTGSLPKDRAWESWVGFRIGPTVRF